MPSSPSINKSRQNFRIQLPPSISPGRISGSNYPQHIVISQKNRNLKLYYNYNDNNTNTNTSTDDDGDEEGGEGKTEGDFLKNGALITYMQSIQNF